MEKQQNSKEMDIAEQTYQGPGAAITSLGHTALDSHVSWIASIALGIATSLYAPKPMNKFFADWRSGTTRWKDTGNIAQKVAGWVSHALLESGKWSSEHLPGREWLAPRLGPERWHAASNSAGILTTLTFFGSMFTGISRGSNEANKGRDQFNQAKDVIKDLRAENTSLRTRLAETKLDAIIEPTVHASASALPKTRIDAESITHTPPTKTELTR